MSEALEGLLYTFTKLRLIAYGAIHFIMFPFHEQISKPIKRGVHPQAWPLAIAYGLLKDGGGGFLPIGCSWGEGLGAMLSPLIRL